MCTCLLVLISLLQLAGCLWTVTRKVDIGNCRKCDGVIIMIYMIIRLNNIIASVDAILHISALYTLIQMSTDL